MIEHDIATTTHGRYLTIPAASSAPAPLLIGFHGYGEDAETQLERLRTIPRSDQWLVGSIQGLHRFYNRRTNEVVASWMTRQNREQAIADNIAYVKACIDAIGSEWGSAPAIVFAGFSQGVAMAFRAAANSTRPVAGVIAVGGDVPPDVLPELRKLPAALIARGASDNLYPEDQFRRDEQCLQKGAVKVQALTLTGGHEWSDDFAEPASRFLDSLRR